jgi:hypothetical protein
MHQYIFTFVKNGFYIPFIFPLFYYATQRNVLLSTTATLKLFPANYFFWYSHKYDYLFADRRYNQLKQFVRFTDTGYLALILAVHSQSRIPLAFNIHFVITFGYWIAKCILGLDDVDRTNGPTYSVRYEYFWGALIHGVPLILLSRSLILDDRRGECPNYFSIQDLRLSYIWCWTWLFCIYIPWRLRTGDPVYSFMAWKSPHAHKLAGCIMVYVLLGISNSLGYYIHVGANTIFSK